MRELKVFFVTFGFGTFMRGYYQEIIYETAPKDSKPLCEQPEMLFYSSAEHVA